MVHVGFERPADVPLAGRELLDARQCLMPRTLELHVVELFREVGIGVDDADHRWGHRRVSYPSDASSKFRRHARGAAPA